MVRINAATMSVLVLSTIGGVIVCPLDPREAVAQEVAPAGKQLDGPLTVYRLDPITSVRTLPDCFPEVPGEVGGELRLSGCRDEYESASFAVYAHEELQNLRLEIGDLRTGDHILANAHFDPYVVKCWYQAGRAVMFHDGVKRLVPELLLKDDALVKVDFENQTNAVRTTVADGATKDLRASGMDPQFLEELRPMDASTLQAVTISAQTLKQFWLTLHIPVDAVAGKYRGSLYLSAEGVAPVEVPLEVTVHAFELAQPKMIYSIYYQGKLDPKNQPNGTIAAHYKSEEQYLVELRDMIAHGVRYPNLWQTYASGFVPRALQLRKEAGLPSDRLFINSPPGAPASAAGTVQRWRKLAADFGYQDIYLYGLDEASGNRLRIQKPSWDNVQKAGGRMYASAWKEDPFEVMGSLLDVLVWSGGLQPEKAKRWHSVGSKIFSYSNPQVGVEEPLFYRYNFGLALWKAGYDGAMDFAYQHAYGHIWNDFDSERFRDHCFTYPTVHGVVGTLQWEGFREGVDDVRYITTLEQVLETAGDTETAVEARQWLDALRRQNAQQQGSWKAQSLPADLDQIRAWVASWIKQLAA